MTNTQDITRLLFQFEEISTRQRKENELWARACEEARLVVESESPMILYVETDKVYQKYLKEEK